MLQISMNNNQDSLPAPAAPDTQAPALSPRRLAAHRANAQKCTGPLTVEGKATSRLNALKHGFFSSDVVNPLLDGPARAEEFHSILDALLEDFQPQSARERLLVDEVAACCWRIRRLLRYECRESWVDEDDYRRAARTETPSEAMAAIMGYDRQAARQHTFRKLHRAGLDTLILPSDSDIDKIVRYERLIKRNLYRALYTLERMRAARTGPDPSNPTGSPRNDLSLEERLS
jgi:hypothetical protein